MTTLVNYCPIARRPLSRVLVLILAGAFAGLMTDLRVEHVEAVRDHPIAWLPILYCGAMAIACFIAFLLWNNAARRVLLIFFLFAFVLGGTGFYVHNHGHVEKVVKASIDAWIDPNMNHSEAPPQQAPLAFAGLGVIGALASLKRFDS